MLRFLVGLILVVSIGWWATGPSSDEVTVYRASCTNGVKVAPYGYGKKIDFASDVDFKKFWDAKKECRILASGSTTYKLNKIKGEVYYLLADTTMRQKDCAIFNNRNWSCEYPDGSKTVIIDGLDGWNPDGSSNRYSNTFSLNRWQWWYVTLYWMVMSEGPQARWLVPDQKTYIQ